MPNWCMNKVSIVGPRDQIAELWGRMNDKGGLLEAMVPIGEWDYGTASETWGTKWDVNTENLMVMEISDGRMEISGSFDSAWSPPIACFEKFMEKNEDIDIFLEYFEPGMQFYGAFSRTDGDMYEEFGELSEVPDEIREDWNMDDWYPDGDEEESEFADAYPIPTDDNGTPIEDDEDEEDYR